MATHAPITGATTRAPISWPISREQRLEIEREVEHLIALLDAADGDPDLELNGDEADGNGLEDDFMRHGDPGGEDVPSHLDMRPIADPAAYKHHLRRIRRTRCNQVVSLYLYRGAPVVEYRLKANDA